MGRNQRSQNAAILSIVEGARQPRRPPININKPKMPTTNAEWEKHWKAAGLWRPNSPKAPSPIAQEPMNQPPPAPPNAIRRVAARITLDMAAVSLIEAHETGADGHTLFMFRQKLAFAVAEWLKVEPTCPVHDDGHDGHR